MDTMGLLKGFPMGKYEASTFTTSISLEDFTVFVVDLSGLQDQPSLHMYTHSVPLGLARQVCKVLSSDRRLLGITSICFLLFYSAFHHFGPMIC